MILTFASMFLLAAGGIGRIGGAAFIISYFFYLRHSINAYRELGVETIGKDGFADYFQKIAFGNNFNQ